LQIVFAAVAIAAVYGEAEADPYLLYGGHSGYYGYAGQHHGLAYNLGKSAPCVNYANVPVPCADGGGFAYAGYHGLHKREAEAEPQFYSAGYPLAYAGQHHGYPYAYAGSHYAPAAIHSSHFGVCTNYLGAQVSC
jgi:hypothetical protein